MRYAKPPIVEAVVGIRFENELDAHQLEGVAEYFLRRYPNRQDEQAHTLAADQTGIHVSAGPVRTKLVNDSSMVLISANEFSTIRLAPYPGWEDFSSEAISNLQAFRETAGFRKLVHLGMRFINRIDIPTAGAADIDIGRFILIGPALPPSVNAHAIESYFLTTQISYSENVRTLVQTGPISEILIGHSSILLDIDVTLKNEFPQRIDAIPKILLDLRNIKNEIFEACITDSARALFEVQPL